MDKGLLQRGCPNDGPPLVGPRAPTALLKDIRSLFFLKYRLDVRIVALSINFF